jgi:hypothetical protein
MLAYTAETETLMRGHRVTPGYQAYTIAALGQITDCCFPFLPALL